MLADAVHSEGAKIMLELGCGLGRCASVFSGDCVASASEVPSLSQHSLCSKNIKWRCPKKLMLGGNEECLPMRPK